MWFASRRFWCWHPAMQIRGISTNIKSMHALSQEVTLHIYWTIQMKPNSDDYISCIYATITALLFHNWHLFSEYISYWAYWFIPNLSVEFEEDFFFHFFFLKSWNPAFKSPKSRRITLTRAQNFKRFIWHSVRVLFHFSTKDCTCIYSRIMSMGHIEKMSQSEGGRWWQVQLALQVYWTNYRTIYNLSGMNYMSSYKTYSGLMARFTNACKQFCYCSHFEL